jgi:hypothetical protein
MVTPMVGGWVGGWVRGDPRGGWVGSEVTPVVDGWVRGQKRTRVRFIFPMYIFIVSLNFSQRETPKNMIKNKTKIGFGFGFVSDFLVTTFRHDIFVFCFVVLF